MSSIILTITPNPSIDRLAVIRNYQVGAIHRPERTFKVAGGKGLHVSRTIRQLGGDVAAAVLVGGHGGRWIVEQLEEQGIQVYSSWVPDESRCNLSVYDSENNTLTEIYEYGPTINSATWEQFEEVALGASANARLVTLSGSLPPGAPTDGYARLIAAIQRRGIPSFLDSHGPELSAALEARPHLIKINGDEAGELTGHAVEGLADAQRAAEIIVQHGVNTAVITLGARGSVVMTGEQVWRVTLPAVEAQSPVGSGDVLLGALALAIKQGKDFVYALRFAHAVATANTLRLGAGRFDLESIEWIYGEIVVDSF